MLVDAHNKKPNPGACILGTSFLYIENLLEMLPFHSAALSDLTPFAASLSFLNTLTIRENMCEVLKLQLGSQNDQLYVAMSFFVRNNFKSAISLNIENTYMCFRIMEC